MLESSIHVNQHETIIHIRALTAHLNLQVSALEEFCVANQAWRESYKNYASLVTDTQYSKATSEDFDYDEIELIEALRAASTAYLTSSTSCISSINLIIKETQRIFVINSPSVVH